MRGQGYTYAAIAKQLPKRNALSVKNRYCYRLSPGKENEQLQLPLVGYPKPVAEDRHGTLYTAEEDAQVLRWQAEGKKRWAIARDMGRTSESVKTRVRDFLRSPWSKAMQEAGDSVKRDKAGRVSRRPASPQEAMTVVYLRNKLGLKWIDIAQQLPHRSSKTLQLCYHQIWYPKYKDVALTDPRVSSKFAARAGNRSGGTKTRSSASQGSSQPSRAASGL